MLGLTTRLQAWAFTALAVLLVLVGAYALGGRAARRSTEEKYKFEKARREAAAAKGAHDAQMEVDALPTGGAADELRRNWMRDADDAPTRGR
jgi:hypothetical protein